MQTKENINMSCRIRYSLSNVTSRKSKWIDGATVEFLRKPTVGAHYFKGVWLVIYLHNYSLGPQIPSQIMHYIVSIFLPKKPVCWLDDWKMVENQGSAKKVCKDILAPSSFTLMSNHAGLKKERSQ